MSKLDKVVRPAITVSLVVMLLVVVFYIPQLTTGSEVSPAGEASKMKGNQLLWGLFNAREFLIAVTFLLTGLSVLWAYYITLRFIAKGGTFMVTMLGEKAVPSIIVIVLVSSFVGLLAIFEILKGSETAAIYASVIGYVLGRQGEAKGHAPQGGVEAAPGPGA